MRYLQRLLKFMRITDEQGDLSLTNIAVMASIYKLITTDATGYTEIGTVMISLLNYGHKRMINKKDQNV